MPAEALPPEDLAWLASFTSIPDGAVFDGFVSVISWMDPTTGESHWRHYHNMDRPISQIVGLLDMAKFDMLIRSCPPGALGRDRPDSEPEPPD